MDVPPALRLRLFHSMAIFNGSNLQQELPRAANVSLQNGELRTVRYSI